MKQFELKAEQLSNPCDFRRFTFETTAGLVPYDGIVGQERASEALEFGLKIRRYGYNIFITGATGTGRNKYSQSLTKKIAETEKTPEDWCYLFNFDKPDQPQVIGLPAGKGAEFKEEMKKLIGEIMTIIPEILASESSSKAKSKLMQAFKDKQNKALAALNETARELGFSLKNTDKGLITVPLNEEGRPYEEEEFNNLKEEVARKIEENSNELNLILHNTFKKLKDIENETHQEIEKLEKQLVLDSIEDLFMQSKERYQGFPKIQRYLNDVLDDIIKNLRLFREKDEKSGLELLFFRDERVRDFTYRYQVNLLVDNSKTTGAPVVLETNPTYYNLLGKMEYEAHLGVLSTDFMKIKPGSLHKANGGYLIIQCRDLLTNLYSWNVLKRALKTEKIYMENLGEQLGITPTSTLKPEPIPLDVKVILIGSYWEYRLLYNYDEDYRKLFKIRADFDVEMERTAENEDKLAQIISYHCKRENLCEFDSTALARIVEHSSRMADNQDKLSTRFNDLVEIIYEADAWAKMQGAGIVTGEYVKLAIAKKVYRANKYEEKIRELIAKGILLIDVEGKEIGQVNGLAVIDLGEYSFGKPSRITANTYIGKKGIINIEREAKLSGPIHDKGVLILSGYLGGRFGGLYPLSFSASICFEQSYEGIEGDSASSGELYAMLSSLSGIPLNQGIAVTGSVNQKGHIQAIGGVNQKIEGYFAICRHRGLTGKQGVIIPQQNVKNLMLEDEIREAVKKGDFHIYAINTIEEGMEILTEKSWDEIYNMVSKKLKKLHMSSKDDDPPSEAK